jgi:hypothetical protein
VGEDVHRQQAPSKHLLGGQLKLWVGLKSTSKIEAFAAKIYWEMHVEQNAHVQLVWAWPASQE